MLPGFPTRGKACKSRQKFVYLQPHALKIIENEKIDVSVAVIPCLLILAFGSGPFEFGSRFYIG